MSIIGLKSTSCRRWIKYNLSIASNTKEKGEGVRGEKNKQKKKAHKGITALPGPMILEQMHRSHFRF